MFRCQICNQVVPAGTRSQKLTLKTRPKQYSSRGRDPSERRRSFRDREPRQPYDKGGEGREIVQEVMVCPQCAAQYAKTPAVEVGAPAPTGDEE